MPWTRCYTPAPCLCAALCYPYAASCLTLVRFLLEDITTVGYLQRPRGVGGSAFAMPVMGFRAFRSTSPYTIPQAAGRGGRRCRLGRVKPAGQGCCLPVRSTILG